MGDNTKTLWLLMYHTGRQEITRDTVGHLEFFYAADEGEARAQADDFKRKRAEDTGEVIHEEYLERQERGFTVHGAVLSGRVEFDPDGTPKTFPLFQY